MAMHHPSWLRETGAVWIRYFAIVLAAIPSAFLAERLINGGFSEQKAMMISVPFALAVAFCIWRIAFRREAKTRRIKQGVSVRITFEKIASDVPLLPFGDSTALQVRVITQSVTSPQPSSQVTTLPSTSVVSSNTNLVQVAC